MSSPGRRRTTLAGGALPTKKVMRKAKTFEYKTCIKKRSVAYILNQVQKKLRRLLSDATTHSPEDIDFALSNPETEQVLKRRITDKSI